MLHCLIITAIRLMLCSRQIQKFTTRSFIPLNMPCESINLVSAHIIILFCLNQKHRRPVQFPRYAFQVPAHFSRAKKPAIGSCTDLHIFVHFSQIIKAVKSWSGCRCTRLKSFARIIRMLPRHILPTFSK